jgi:hypothetical protein
VDALVLGLDGGQGARHAGAHVMHVLFVALGIFLEQDFAGNLLFGRQGVVVAELCLVVV